MSVPFTICNDSINVVFEGKPYTVKEGSANFAGLRDALLSKNWAAVPKFLTVAKTVENWVYGDFKVQGDTVLYKGQTLPSELNQRITLMVAKGEKPTNLLKFWERLQANPSWRSVQQLFQFLDHSGIPIDKDGFFLAYKGVKSDYTDCHTGKIDNKPGTKHEMPRNRISDDPKEACHFGFHVGAIGYARDFGPRTVICRVDPADVVCVPYDHNAMKMRVCKYEVIGNYGSKLSDTTFDEADKPKLESKPTVVAPAVSPAPADAKVKRNEAQAANFKAAAEEKIEGRAEWADLADKFESMDMDELRQQPLSELRSYAANVLKIVGASKIPGGKTILVQRIIETRDGDRKNDGV